MAKPPADQSKGKRAGDQEEGRKAARAAASRKATAATRKRGEGRHRILEAAIDLFANLGYDAVSTTDVAREADSSQSVVIYHFGSKEGLWQAAMRELFARVDVRSVAAQSVYKDLSPLDRLRVLLRRFVIASARNPQLGRVIFREGINGGDRLQWLVREVADPQYTLFVEALRQASELGLIRAYNPVMMTLMVHSAGATLFNLGHLSAILLKKDPFSEDLIEQQADMLVDTFFRGLVIAT